jgi:alpha-galactosidase
MSYFDILRIPDRVSVFAPDQQRLVLARQGDHWSPAHKHRDVRVFTWDRADHLGVEVTADGTFLESVQLRWHGEIPPGLRYLGDHWERGYGDLAWRGLVPQRLMPWYFLTYDGQVTHGYGVKTGAKAFGFWTVDDAGVSLWLDVRSGGVGVALDGRTLPVADVVARKGQGEESPFTAARAFGRILCDQPRLSDHPVYGSNNWYYAYGKSSHAEILDDTRLLVSLAPDIANRPYMVIDAGWQAGVGDDGPASSDACGGSAWDRGNVRFPDMPGLAEAMRDLGARPGIWVRPLVATPADDERLLLPRGRFLHRGETKRFLDPTIPEVLARIRADMAHIRGWGYELIKHDFTTYDILGRWGFQMGNRPGETCPLTNGGWRFADRSRTTAEIILDLYRTIREGAGDAVVIGCNTVGHLGAGLFELQRTGDDTSGRSWERTRKMGINTLAFRMLQHDAFFACDADCVGLTHQVPWGLNRQWLDLLARSGTPLFVSADPAAVGPEQARALKTAYAVAAHSQPVGEPRDWLETTCPQTWRLGAETVTFDWYGDQGIYPFLG